jgi:hypothetical protein
VKELHGHELVELGVPRSNDHTHASRTDDSLDSVLAGDHFADRYRHRRH